MRAPEPVWTQTTLRGIFFTTTPRFPRRAFDYQKGLREIQRKSLLGLVFHTGEYR